MNIKKVFAILFTVFALLFNIISLSSDYGFFEISSKLIIISNITISIVDIFITAYALKNMKFLFYKILIVLAATMNTILGVLAFIIITTLPT